MSMLLLQNFSNALLGVYNSAMDVYERWVSNDDSLGPQQVGPNFEDYVSGATDLNGLWEWLQETGAELTEEEFKAKVEEKGVDAFRPPVEVHKCDWHADITTGLDRVKELAAQGLADAIVPPTGKDGKQWVMEVILCVEEARDVVILAGMTPTVIDYEPQPGDASVPEIAGRIEAVKHDHERVEGLPKIAAKLLDYRKRITTQLCVEKNVENSAPARGNADKAPPIAGSRFNKAFGDAFCFTDDNDTPAWLDAAKLSPDCILNMCDNWEEEAVMHASNTPQMSDSDWDDLCETLRVLAADRGVDVQPLIEFHHSCPGMGIPAKPNLFELIGPARVVVSIVADGARAQISRKVASDSDRG